MTKVVILAGGLGSRLGSETQTIPKPMVQIGSKPILLHLMDIFISQGFNDFIIALGYKADFIRNYFLNLQYAVKGIHVCYPSGTIEILDSRPRMSRFSVSLIDTGARAMTGGRLLGVKEYVGDEPFIFTYGDGLANVNLKKLVQFHGNHSGCATVTAVRPAARFGKIQFGNNEQIIRFEEKPQADEGWINGGFFVLDPEVFELLDDESCVFEAYPLERLAATGQLSGFKHHGFWQCLDTPRDKEYLESLAIQSDALPWLEGA